jgi:hypothetical protein
MADPIYQRRSRVLVVDAIAGERGPEKSAENPEAILELEIAGSHHALLLLPYARVEGVRMIRQPEARPSGAISPSQYIPGLHLRTGKDSLSHLSQIAPTGQ